MVYNYSIIRFVPDVVAGEFINIGTIVGNQKSEWVVRVIHDLRRAKALDHRGYLDSAMDFIGELSEKFLANPSMQELERMREDLNNTVQISPIYYTLASSFSEALNLIVRDYFIEGKELEAGKMDTHRKVYIPPTAREYVEALENENQKLKDEIIKLQKLAPGWAWNA